MMSSMTGQIPKENPRSWMLGVAQVVIPQSIGSELILIITGSQR